MEFMTMTLIAVGLAMDALAVSLGIGTAGEIPGLRAKIRLAASFGLFQSGMTAVGWLAGETVVQYVKDFGHWIAFALLAYVAFKLIRAGLDENRRSFQQDPSIGGTLIILSLATSIDALAVGLSIAILRIPVLYSVALIGAVTSLLSGLGLLAGVRLGVVFGKRMEIVGGLILLGIGVRVVLTHLLP